MNSFWKKSISLVIVVSLSLSFFPMNALAQQAGVNPQSCPAGQKLDTTGTVCVPIAITGGTITPPTTTTNGLTTNQQTYTPQVTLQYGQNNSFGGLTFKGVGSALLTCSGFGNVVAGAVTSAIGAVTSIVGGAVKGALNYITGGIFGSIFGSGSSTPGKTASNPQHVKDDNLENKAACLDGIAYVLSQQVLQQITNRTLHWANTGFNGNPLYIKDIDSYLLSIRNQQLTSFLQGAQSDPIFGNALRSIVTQQTTGLSDGRLNTSLTTPQAQSYNAFMGDFTSGGWDALLNPSYNPIGALFNTSDSLTQSITSQQQNAQNEIQRNNGYLDMKTCVQYANNGQVGNTNGAGLNATPTCAKYETVTPGSLVAAQVANITTSPTRQAELATQFNEAVGSFFDSLLNQLFSRGLSGIKGAANPADLGLSYGGLGSNTVTGVDGSTLSGVNDGVQSINDIAAANSTVDISRPQLLRAVLQTQYDYVNRASDADVILGRVVPELGKLDYCLPGPNPSWQDSLSDNLTTYTSATTFLEASGYNGSSTASTTGLSLYDKVTLASVPVASRMLTVSNTDDIKSYLQSVSTSLQQDITNTFSRDALSAAYAATAVGATNQAYASGMASDAYDEVAGLPTFVQTATTQDQQYGQNIATTQQDIQQLEDINRQVLSIVSVAKARYIAQQKAAGTPINQQCIDAAYVIDNSAVTGVTRQETNALAPIIQQSNDANKYFYSTL